MNEIVLRAQGISNHVFGPEWGPQVYTFGHSLAMIVIVLVPVLLTVLYYQLVERWVIGWIHSPRGRSCRSRRAGSSPTSTRRSC
jgi:hypothetical protein